MSCVAPGPALALDATELGGDISVKRCFNQLQRSYVGLHVLIFNNKNQMLNEGIL